MTFQEFNYFDMGAGGVAVPSCALSGSIYMSVALQFISLRRDFSSFGGQIFDLDIGEVGLWTWPGLEGFFDLILFLEI